MSTYLGEIIANDKAASVSASSLLPEKAMNIIADAMERLLEASDSGRHLSGEQVWQALDLLEGQWAEFGRRTAAVLLRLFVDLYSEQIKEGRDISKIIAKHGGHLLTINLSNEDNRRAVREVGDLFMDPAGIPQMQPDGSDLAPDSGQVKWVKKSGRVTAEGVAVLSRHDLYVEGLFELLYQKRLEKLRESGVAHTHTDPEFAQLGIAVTATVFHLLVTFRAREVEGGEVDVEALWDDFMMTYGNDFAEALIDPGRRPLAPSGLWKWLVRSVVTCTALSLSQPAGVENSTTLSS
jgi:hypothetical protein